MYITLTFPVTPENSIVQFAPEVKRLASRYAQNRVGAEFDDLVSAANLAISSAIETAQCDSDVRETTAYLRAKARGAILDCVRNAAPITRRYQELRKVYVATVEALEGTLGREPTDDEIAAKLSVSVERVRKIQIAITPRACVSLDTADETGSSDWIHREATSFAASQPWSSSSVQELDPASSCEAVEFCDEVQRLVDALPDHQKYMIRETFFNGRSLADCAASLNLTKARCSQIRTQALRSLNFPAAKFSVGV